TSRVDEIGPIADRPIVADGADRRHALTMRSVNRWQRRQHVRAVHEIDALTRDDSGEQIAQRWIQALVLEVVPDVRQCRSGEARLDDTNSLVVALARSVWLAR